MKVTKLNSLVLLTTNRHRCTLLTKHMLCQLLYHLWFIQCFISEGGSRFCSVEHGGHARHAPPSKNVNLPFHLAAPSIALQRVHSSITNTRSTSCTKQVLT